MKRFIISCVIFVFMIGFCFFTLNHLYHTKTQLLTMLCDMQALAEDNQYEKAASLAKSFNEYWDEEEKVLIRYIRHSPLDSITSIAARLEALAAYEEKGQLLAHIEELRVNIHHLWDSEIPLLRNVL